MVRRIDCPAMTIVVDLGHKARKQNKISKFILKCAADVVEQNL